MNYKQSRYSFSNPVLWGFFILYIILLGYTTAHHELWGDELHSWNIAKASNSFSGLISNTRYEGHPPLWYCILWVVSKFTHDVTAIQYVQFVIAGFIAFLILFISPMPLMTRILIPFGYFFLYEYAVFSRNYAVGILLTFCICIILYKNFKFKLSVYYILLFLLSNTHLLALLLAAGLHLYYLLMPGKNKKLAVLAFHSIAGLLILLPAVYFIFPPSDSSLGTDFWLERWDLKQLLVIVKAPVRAFIPVPAWWNYHFWNTEFLLEAQYKYGFLKWIILILSIALFSLVAIILKKDKKSLIFFLAFSVLLFFVSAVIPFANARQVGFLYVGFLVAFWLYCYHNPVTRSQHRIVNGLLVIQIIAGVLAVSKEIKYPFSQGYRVKDLVSQVPAGNKLVTDYWCLNTLLAFTDKPYHCVDLQKESFYLMWNQEIAKVIKSSDPYSEGFKNLFRQEDVKQLYMISNHSPESISRRDSQLFTLYRMEVVDKKEGAIEKGSNLYLYKVSQN